jgi:hypothetical protein
VIPHVENHMIHYGDFTWEKGGGATTKNPSIDVISASPLSTLLSPGVLRMRLKKVLKSAMILYVCHLLQVFVLNVLKSTVCRSPAAAS